MYMKSQFPQAWLACSSHEINQITRGSGPLRWLNFENCESEPYINRFIIRIPLYCKFFDDRCTWLKDCRSVGMNFRYQISLLPIILYIYISYIYIVYIYIYIHIYIYIYIYTERERERERERVCRRFVRIEIYQNFKLLVVLFIFCDIFIYKGI